MKELAEIENQEYLFIGNESHPVLKAQIQMKVFYIF